AIVARAQAARAEDALHGASQLSQSAQRAPTAAACDEGWRRVAELVSIAVAAGTPETAATAQELLAARNDAYVFHADPGFSLGGGWPVAAAAVRGGALMQVEPDRAGTAQAERFLRDAGLGDRLRPYRPRPRASKQVTEIVARAFRADPAGAQARL